MSKKKDDKCGQIPHMRDMTIAEQDMHIQRWKLRNALRTSQNEVIGAMLQWVIDDPNIELFVATGHAAVFSKTPTQDLFVRMTANGFTADEIEEALKRDETPISWMIPEQLIAIDQRITLMKQYFATQAPGPFAQALEVYRVFGEAVRRNFFQRYGYYPEQSPIPRVRITGSESEKKKLKPDDHQPTLM